MYIFQLNFLGIHIAPTYYGLMYAIGFLVGYQILLYRNVLSKNKLDDLFLYIFLGVILGGRIGYVLFYNLDYYINNIIDIVKIWEGGMSFHGGLIGVVISLLLFSRKFKINFFKISDQISLVVPIGLLTGRIGNYLNNELLGFSPYNGFLSININGISHFPSSLLESFLEGFILFIILNYINSKKISTGIISGVFLLLYGLFRFLVEFVRLPDVQIGYLAFGWLTMGQVLSFVMIIIGSFVIIKSKNIKG